LLCKIAQQIDLLQIVEIIFLYPRQGVRSHPAKMKNIDDIRGKKINGKMIYIYIYIFQGERYYLTIKLYCTFNIDVSLFAFKSTCRERSRKRNSETQPCGLVACTNKFQVCVYVVRSRARVWYRGLPSLPWSTRSSDLSPTRDYRDSSDSRNSFVLAQRSSDGGDGDGDFVVIIRATRSRE